MDRQIVNARDLDLDSPGRRDYLVALPHDGIWGDHLIPLTVFVGPRAKPGRGLVAFGSTHGNEYEGPVAIKHLLGEIDMADVLGRIILVPVLNVAAFRAGTRDSVNDDGVNLNRAFVADAGLTPSLGRITHRIADFVRTSIPGARWRSSRSVPAFTRSPTASRVSGSNNRPAGSARQWCWCTRTRPRDC
jgi:predicted deacylase